MIKHYSIKIKHQSVRFKKVYALNNRTACIRVIAVFLLSIISEVLFAQVISTTSPFDYGTGVVAGNPGYPALGTGGTAVISYSGNDATITGSGTIATGSTNTSGIFNFHNLTINPGVVVTLSGTSPLVIRCTGTANILGTLTAVGGAGGNTLSSVPGIGGTSGGGGGAAGGLGGGVSINGNVGASYPGTSGRGLGGIAGVSIGGYGGSGGCHALVGGNGPAETNDGLAYGDSLFATILNSTNLLGGSGGGGGGGNSSPARAGAGGGGGGGAFSITADSIIIGSSGLLSVKGGAGGNMSDNNSSAGGAGGGGSGGSILLQYHSQLSGAGTPNTNPSPLGQFHVDISGGLKGIYYIGGDGSQGYYLSQKDSSVSTLDNYQTIANGNWNDVSIWQKQVNGVGSWVAATTTPDFNDGYIYVYNDVHVTSSVTIDQTVVQSSTQPLQIAAITVDSGQALTINDGTGTDLTVNGLSGSVPAIITQTGTLTVNPGAPVIFNAYSSYIHNRDSGYIPMATWNTNSDCNIIGATANPPLNMSQNFYNFLWDNPNQAAVMWFGVSNFPTGINGTFEVRRCGASSQCNWDPPVSLVWAGDIIISANRNLIYTSQTITVNTFTFRDLYITNAYGAASKLIISNEGNTQNYATLNARNLNISGGALDFNGIYANNTSFNLSGSFTMAGGSIINSNGLTQGVSAFNFSGTAQQDVNISGAALISGLSVDYVRTLQFTANSGSIVNFATPFACGSGNYVKFTASAGSTLIIPDPGGIVAAAGTALGSVRTPATGGGATFSTGASYTYDGTATQVTGAGLPATVKNLTFLNPVGVTCPVETVSGNLTLTNAIVTLTGSVSVIGTTAMNSSLLTLGNNNLTMTGAFTGAFSTTDKVITNGSGSLIKVLPAAATVTFPVADTSSVYTPCTVTYTAGTFNGATSLACRVINAVEPYLTGTDKIKRYWTLTDNIAGGTGNATFNYLPADVSGNENNIYGVRYSGGVPEEYSVADAINHRISAIGFSDFTTADYTGTDQILGVQDVTSQGLLSIYPNPVSSKCHIRFDQKTNDSKCNLQIIDLTGAVVQTINNLTIPGTGVYGFNIADNITSGVYFIKLTRESDVYTQKVIVIKE